MTDESNLSGQAQVDEAGQGEAGEGTSSASVKCCTDCELTFSTLAKYKYHRLRLHGAWKAGFPCPDCHATFSSVSNLKRHRKKVHEQEADPPSASGPICPYPHCGHVAKDNHHLKVHMRKHTGERPFECPLCSFGFYKKSDLTKHQKGCGGVKFRCSACAKPFHFKRQLQEHLVWSKSCGVMELEEDAKATPSRYMNPGERPSIVRLNVSRDQSVVGVNCPIDEARYVKRKRRARCGLCNGCQRTDDCDACSNCRGECKKTRCKLRLCINLVEQYDVKGDGVEGRETTEEAEVVVIAT